MLPSSEAVRLISSLPGLALDLSDGALGQESYHQSGDVKQDFNSSLLALVAISEQVNKLY